MSVITAADVEAAHEVLAIAAGDIVTPLARDRAKELRVRIERSATRSNGVPRANVSVPAVRSAGPPPGGLPSASVARGSAPPEPHRLPRSGALYRRGGYGLNGARNVGDVPDRTPARGRPSIAVIGAGHVGAASAIRLAESDAFERVTLVDVVDGLAAGLALDMWHSAALQNFTTRVEGGTQIEAVAGADIVVITAGRPRQPGMTRTDLTAANAEIIAGLAPAIRERAGSAIVVVVTNPLEEMTALTARLTGFAPERVVGMGGVLDTARFRALVGLTGIARPGDVQALVLGSHGEEMVIPLSQATVNGVLLETLLDAATLAEIVARTRSSGAEVTHLMQAGSAYISPGNAIARQIAAIARGATEVVPACVASGGAYGLANVHIGLPVRLGPRGVEEIVELRLRDEEIAALRAAAEHIGARMRALR